MKLFIVGRGEEADIIILNHTISRIHMSIRILELGQIELHDLASTNGSYLLRHEEKIDLSVKQIANRTDHLMLGDYRTSVADLLHLLPSTESTDTNDVRRQPAKSDKIFSRYIRAEDGKYVRKK